MSSMVAYRGSRTLAGYAYQNRNKIARIAGGVYRNRYKIIKSARKIQRWYRGARKTAGKARLRRQIGERVGAETALSAGTSNNQLLIATKTLYEVELTKLDEGPLPNERQRNIVNFRGVKLCLEMENLNTTNNVYFNYCVVHPKKSRVMTNNQFFRGNGIERALDFTDSNLQGLDYHCRPINTDYYTVLAHKRFILGNRTGSGTGGANRVVQKVHLRYIKLNRQLRYDNIEGVDACVTPMFLAYWCTFMGSTTSASPVADQVRFTRRTITYFRNPK